MVYPIPNYTRVKVRGHFVDMAKAAREETSYGLTGPVQFIPTPLVAINQGSQQIIEMKPFVTFPDPVTGYFEIMLPSTDDPDLVPVEWNYKVIEPTGRSYYIVVPYDTPVMQPPDPNAGEQVIDLVDVVPDPEANAGTIQLLHGRPGRDITSVTIDGASHLVGTYSDLTNWDAGLLPVASVAGKTGVITLVKGDVGLGNVDNTSDVNKPLSTASQTALAGKQPLDPDLTAIAAISPADNDLVQRKAGAWTNRTIAQVKTDLTLVKADVGLGSVDNVASATLLARANHTGTQSADTVVDGTTNHVFTAADDTKLTGITAGATPNSPDATLLARANHTGSQATSTVTGLDTALAGKASTTHTHVATTDLTATGTKNDTTFLRGDNTWATPIGGGGGGVTDHGALTGLTDDDHLQYHTDTRGDVRYYTKSAADTLLSGKANTAHTHAAADVTSGQFATDRMPQVASTVRALTGSTGTITIDPVLVGNNRNYTASGAITFGASTTGASDRQVIRIAVYSPTSARTVSFGSAIRTSTGLTRGTYSVAANEVFLGAIEYSSLISAWVLTAATVSAV